MKNKGYIIIQDWMLDLPLSLVETATYAIIYGFSQDGESVFEGSLAYLARKTKVTRDTARKSLRKLVDEGLIEKREVIKNNITFNTYRVISVGDGKIQPPIENCKGEGGKFQPNNKEYNDIDKSISIKNKRGFVPPTFDEVDFYCCERGNSIDPQAFIDYYTSNGWKVGNNPMKDWKAAVRTWEKREQQKPAKPAAQSTQKKSYFQHNNEILEKLLGGGQSNG